MRPRVAGDPRGAACLLQTLGQALCSALASVKPLLEVTRKQRRHRPRAAQEKEYILQEARKRFREGRQQELADKHLEKRLEEGQQRLEYAQHYGIPFPRLHHSKGQFRGRRYDVPE